MATKHKHHEPHGESLISAAARTLTAAGEQWTDMRASVFEALAQFDRPVSAYDVADSVSKARDKRVAANSIYRILDLFVTTNLAKRVESKNAYIVNAHPDCVHDCIFLVCDTCGNTTHLDDDSLSESVRERARRAGFKPVQPVLEVRGTCAGCV
ncbi:Fur family transcriptional regulator [Sphingosinicella soli]|uniref:Fur family zinc uptake transcriptional regulator n=1 Tax=Sphingosinicella soli TaxID=333708 RepID=A0A7W7F692_9SPHN|nr:transcriptional repressor [Sphingosinicella soli]MBB4632285.1 Fur family zinc uptake transcriptional regulator [Sphingosinicella soli]